MTEFLALLHSFWHCIGIETLAKGKKGKGRNRSFDTGFWHSMLFGTMRKPLLTLNSLTFLLAQQRMNWILIL